MFSFQGFDYQVITVSSKGEIKYIQKVDINTGEIIYCDSKEDALKLSHTIASEFKRLAVAPNVESFIILA